VLEKGGHKISHFVATFSDFLPYKPENITLNPEKKNGESYTINPYYSAS